MPPRYLNFRFIKTKEKDTIINFNKHNDQLKQSVVKAQIYANLIMPVNLIVTNIGNILLIAVGTFMIINGKTTIGGLLAFISYSSMFRQPINQLASLFASVNEGLAGAERVFEVIDTPITIKEKKNSLNINHFNGDVILDKVTFGYNNDKMVLNNLSISVRKGETVAIVGKTGAGKTTIANLLPRFYDINQGTIKIDNIDIKDISLKSYGWHDLWDGKRASGMFEKYDLMDVPAIYLLDGDNVTLAKDINPDVLSLLLDYYLGLDKDRN